MVIHVENLSPEWFLFYINYRELSVFYSQSVGNSVFFLTFARRNIIPDENMITTTATIKKSVNNSCQPSVHGETIRDRVLAETISVDEYFDELIDQVKEDYANL